MFPIPFVIYLLIIATGFIVGLFAFKKATVIRPVIILLGATLISEILSRYLRQYIKNSSPGYHFFDPVQIGLWGLFFYHAIKKAIIKKAILVSTVLMIFFSVYCSLFIQGLMTFPDVFLNVASIVLIIWATILFIEKLDSPSPQNIFRDPVFVISASVLWFYFFSFLFFLLHNYFVRNNIPYTAISKLHYYSNIIYYTLLLTAILLSFSFFNDERKIKR